MARCSSVRTTTTRYRTVDLPAVGRVCPGCREALPAQATFCTQCGVCMFEPASGGTVVARRPTPTQPMAAVLAFPEPEVVEVALEDIDVLEEIDTVEIELEEIEIEIEA